MIVDWVLWFNLDCSTMRKNGTFILLDVVEGSSQISVICCNSIIKFESLFQKLDLFILIAQFSNCLPFQIIELTFILIESQPVVAAIDQFVPLFEMKKSIRS